MTRFHNLLTMLYSCSYIHAMLPINIGHCDAGRLLVTIRRNVNTGMDLIPDSDSVYWTCSQKAKNQNAKQTPYNKTIQYETRNEMQCNVMKKKWTKDSDIGLLVVYEGMMNERFVAVSTVAGSRIRGWFRQMFLKRKQKYRAKSTQSITTDVACDQMSRILSAASSR